MKATAPLLYLREEELTDGVELFFFASRDVNRSSGHWALGARMPGSCTLLHATRVYPFRIFWEFSGLRNNRSDV
jgi:hypothetical protein